MSNQLKWDRRFLELARLVSTWSKDPSTQVGCVIVDGRKVVATGYNGFPRGIRDDGRLRDRDEKYPLIVHAEMNAILQGGHAVRDGTMYLWGFPGPPCRNCAKHVITAGICRVVHLAGVVEREEWKTELELATSMLQEAKVLVHAIDLP